MGIDDRICDDGLMYDPVVGVFIWLRKTRNRSLPVGGIAGSSDGQGYRKIRHRGKRFPAHRLAWFLVYGEWPDLLVDHINGIKSDNRISNLRLATRSQNRANSVSTCPLKGAYFHKASQKWISKINFDNKQIHLGTFETQIEAHQAYAVEAKRRFGDFANFTFPKLTRGQANAQA